MSLCPALWDSETLKPVSLSLPAAQITKGKLHGSIDVRLSVMSINKKAQRVDLDTEDNIYHLKVTSLGDKGMLAPRSRSSVRGGECTELRVCPCI